MKKKNTSQFRLLLGLFLFALAVSGIFSDTVQAQTKHPEATVIRGERPPIDVAGIPDTAIEQGIIRIKFNKALESLLDNAVISANPDGTVRFGITGIDQLNQQFGVSEVMKTFDAALQNTKYTERHRLWGFHLWYDLIVPPGTDIRSMVLAYSLKNEIEISEPVYRKQLINSDISTNQQPASSDGNTVLNFVPNDPRYNEQWHYHNTGQQGGTIDADIDLPEAWDITRGNAGVVVAIIDGGIDYTHPDLAANMWPGIGYNFVTNTSVVTADSHGTHVAGTVAANTNNALGVSGVAGGDGSGNGVRLMSCQVLSGGTYSGFHTAPVWAADNGAAISQNSWGYTTPGYFEQAALDAIDYFNLNGGGTMLNGGISIFAANNYNSSGNYYPAYYSGTLAVAATNNNDRKALYSNYGSWVDISAPGGESNVSTARGILSTRPSGTYGFSSGTSNACPHVSGVAALVVSLLPGILTSDQLRSILLNTTDNIEALNPDYAGQLGSGRLNAYQALLLAQQYIVPTAAFSTSSSLICSETEATFIDQTLAPVTSWSWSFPGGFPSSFSGQFPPPILYPAPGLYDVSLTVSDGITTDTETKTAYLEVRDIIVDFAADYTSIVEGGSVQFSTIRDCNSDTWDWSFPGGTPSTFSGQTPPSIAYYTAGNYDVSLTVTKAGFQEIKTVTSYIKVSPASFNIFNGSIYTCAGTFFDTGGSGGDYHINENLTLTFYPSSPGSSVELNFTSFSVESNNDFLRIYNGVSTSSLLIGDYTGTTGPGTVIAHNPDGALTIHFTSNNTLNGPGWSANISCAVKSLELTAFFEGLYNGGGTMRQASNESGPQFGPGIADQITIELHNAGNYGMVEYSDPDVMLNTSGNATVSIPPGFSGSYYITVKHRNSIETTSASPVSLVPPVVNFAFDQPANVYGGNLQLMIDGTHAIFGGDANQDGAVDTGDTTPTDNDQFFYISGYVPTDINGDGSVDTADGTIIDNNQFHYAGVDLP
jgi:subtilisin family serine protease/PKD repeat protein